MKTLDKRNVVAQALVDLVMAFLQQLLINHDFTLYINNDRLNEGPSDVVLRVLIKLLMEFHHNYFTHSFH